MTPLGFILWAVVAAAALILVGIAAAIIYGAFLSMRRQLSRRARYSRGS